jgi:uncharacterized protein YceK
MKLFYLTLTILVLCLSGCVTQKTLPQPNGERVPINK